MLTVRPGGVDPPPLTVSLTVKYCFFMTSLKNFDKKYELFEGIWFLAVQNSSIGDLVTQSLTHSGCFYFWHTKSNPGDLWPLKHLIREMRRHDFQKVFRFSKKIRFSENCHIFRKISNFWKIVWFLEKLSDFQQNFQIFRKKLSDFQKYLDFQKKIRFSEKISDFWKNFRFSAIF